MVNIMATKTIKREITTKNTTVQANTENNNVFKLNEKTMVLTLTVPVEYNKTGTSLKIKDLETDTKGYKYMIATDSKGNKIKLFKTGFEYEPKVKTVATGVDISKAKEVLSPQEQKMLELLMKKMSK